jgi:hypothetical protein
MTDSNTPEITVTPAPSKQKKARKPRSKKPTPAPKTISKEMELEKRLDRTLELYTLGYTETQIGKSLKAEFGINSESVKTDLEKARAVFAEHAEAKREVLRGLYNDMLKDLYQKAYKNKHWKTCTDIIGNLAKINKLYEPEVNDKIIANITYSKAD